MQETGLIGGPEWRDLRLVSHRPSWSRRYQQKRRTVLEALGGQAQSIHHIGSTAVVGLAAKPIIDMLLVLADPAREERYLPALSQVGFHLRVREPDFHEHRMVRTQARDVHVHVFPPGCPEIERYLAFRDQLRKRYVLRRIYEHLKRQLATAFDGDMAQYAAAKGAFVEAVIANRI